MMMPVPDWVSAGGIDRADNLPKAIEREIIHTLPESEPLALRENPRSCRAYSPPVDPQPCKAAVSDRWKKLAASGLSKKVKEQKEKGQPHREDSAFTTQRNPKSTKRVSGMRLGTGAGLRDVISRNSPGAILFKH
jgi:hypothetical protein